MRQTENTSFAAGHSFKHHGQTGGEEEFLSILGNYPFAISLILRTEELFRRTAHHARRNTVGRKQFASCHERRNFRTTGHQHHFGLRIAHHVVSAARCSVIIGTFREIGHILATQDQRRRRIHVLHGHLPAHRGLVDVSRTQHAHGVATGVVLQFLHQADLRFLLHRFVGRTVFTDAECIVAPNEFHGEFHERRHTNGRFHVVREDKERTHRREHTTVERDTDTNTSHRQLAHTGLQETAGEISATNHRRVLQETIRFVRVAKVGRRYNHILDMRGEHTQTFRRSIARRRAGLLLDFVPRKVG